MILGFWVGTLGIIFIAILMIFLFSYLFKLMKKRGIVGGTIGFFIGFALSVFLFVIARSLYVVTGDGECSSYYVYGAPTFEMKSGESVKVDLPMAQSMVINESDTVIILEKVAYGGYFFGGEDYWVEPGEYEIIEAGRIHYFFDDEPPEEISSNSGSDQEFRWWLRNKRE